MNYEEKIDYLERENEAARRKIPEADSRDALFDIYMEVLEIAARILALNEWRLATKSRDDLPNLRREEREEFPGEDVRMDDAAWVEAIVGAWGAGGFIEAQKTAPPKKEARKRVASALASLATDSPLATALAWYLEPTIERICLYIDALLKNGNGTRAASLLWCADLSARSDLRDRADSAMTSALGRLRGERLLAGREEAELWRRLSPNMEAGRLGRIEFTVSILALSRWNEFYISELRAGRLFPLWLEMAPSPILSRLGCSVNSRPPRDLS